jgi:hypothetical protein
MHRLITSLALVLTAPALFAASAKITVSNPLDTARPDEVIVVPFPDFKRSLPDARMFHLEVRDAAGKLVPHQVTNYSHDHHGAEYDELVFTASLAAGRKDSTFTVTSVATGTPPDAPCVYARTVPERYDDMAWETDRIAHRMYGFALNTPAAGGERLRGSGIDVWGKRVSYPIVDRWYAKGHDQFHQDGEGEGFDIYSVGGSRGAGGTGLWDGKKLWTSDNFVKAEVASNGPRRAAFTLSYAPWKAGDAEVAETKRFLVDCAQQLDAIESTFDLASDEGVVGIGITEHPRAANQPPGVLTRDDGGRWMSWWEDSKDGGLGVAVILAPGAVAAGFAHEPAANANGNGNHILLVRVKDGQPVRYFAGAGWTAGKRFANRQAWEDYVRDRAARIAAPVTVTVGAAP